MVRAQSAISAGRTLQTAIGKVGRQFARRTFRRIGDDAGHIVPGQQGVDTRVVEAGMAHLDGMADQADTGSIKIGLAFEPGIGATSEGKIVRNGSGQRRQKRVQHSGIKAQIGRQLSEKKVPVLRPVPGAGREKIGELGAEVPQLLDIGDHLGAFM